LNILKTLRFGNWRVNCPVLNTGVPSNKEAGICEGLRAEETDTRNFSGSQFHGSRLEGDEHRPV